MGTMAFLPELRKFLLAHGEIYTVRRYRMGLAKVVVEGVGTCQRVPKGTVVDMDALRPWVSLSGFDTVEAWWDKILSFIPSATDQSRVAKYLYRVVRLQEV